MKFDKIRPFHDKLLNVIIETPAGSQNKFDYDPRLRIFKLKKTLPMGTMFPFDFGFVPNTQAPDGDPLDVLVLMDQKAFPGCMIQCRLLGVIEAEQKEKGKKPMRNDRIVAVANCSILYADLQDIKDLNKRMAREIENFFSDYNEHEGKKFTPIKWANIEDAIKLIKRHTI